MFRIASGSKLASGSLALTCALTIGVTAAWSCVKTTNTSQTACGMPGSGYTPTGSCHDQVVQDGTCTGSGWATRGLTSTLDYERTCIYQPRTFDPNGGCMNDGGPVTFIAACQKASGDTCTAGQ